MLYRGLRPNVPYITNIAIAYGQQDTVADELMPVVPVDTEIGVYDIFKNVEQQTDESADIRAEGSPDGEVDWSKTTAQYSAVERTRRTFISEERADTIGRQKADTLATELVTGKLDLAREKRIKTIANTSANFGAAQAASASWATAGTDVIGDVRTAKVTVRKRSGFNANTIVIPDDKVAGILHNTALITGGSVVPVFTATEQMATSLPNVLFGLRVITPLKMEQTANLAATPSYSQLWDGTNNVIVAYIDRNPGNMKPTWAVQFRVRTFGVQGVKMQTWFDEMRVGDHLRIRRKQDERVVMADAAVLITGT